MFSEKLATARVHRQNAISLALQVGWYAVSSFRCFCRGANDRDCPGLSIDAQELLTFICF